jgi:predicted aspartyl protease
VRWFLRSPLTVTYQDRIAWGSRRNDTSNRPFCSIRVHGGPGPDGPDLLGLLDTGADYLMLDNDVARILEIDLEKCREVPVTLASGEEALMRKKRVKVTILGKRVPVTAVFGVRGTTIIGRTAILRAIDFGIDMKGWLYR